MGGAVRTEDPTSRWVVAGALMVIPLPLALLLLVVGLMTSTLWLVQASIAASVLGVVGLALVGVLSASTLLRSWRASR